MKKASKPRRRKGRETPELEARRRETAKIPPAKDMDDEPWQRTGRVDPRGGAPL